MKINANAFRRGVRDIIAFRPLRWWLFQRLSAFGWWICPEPHKSRMQAAMPTWDEARRMWETALSTEKEAR